MIRVITCDKHGHDWHSMSPCSIPALSVPSSGHHPDERMTLVQRRYCLRCGEMHERFGLLSGQWTLFKLSQVVPPVRLVGKRFYATPETTDDAAHTPGRSESNASARA